MRLPVLDSRLYPSCNAWDVPTLDLAMQPREVTSPVVAWGSVSRNTRHGGTWCFYVDDARFSSPKLAGQVIASEPAACVEPNFTILDSTPRAEALWAVYRKRRIAREWQLAGIPVFVDLHVPAEMLDLAMMGVPRGWRAYATRGVAGRVNDVLIEWAAARAFSRVRDFEDDISPPPLFLVYGGGESIRELCTQLPGAVYVPDYMSGRRVKG